MTFKQSRALDLSGALVFSAFGFYAFLSGWVALAIGSGLAVAAFVISMLVARIRQDNTDDPIVHEDPAPMIRLGRGVAFLALLCILVGLVGLL